MQPLVDQGLPLWNLTPHSPNMNTEISGPVVAFWSLFVVFRRLQQPPYDRHRKRYRSHPGHSTRQADLRIGCQTGGTVDVLQSDV